MSYRWQIYLIVSAIFIIIVVEMAQPRRSSTTQLAEINSMLMAQNNKLGATAKVAEESLNTQNNIQNELLRQRGVIEGNIDKVPP